MGKYLQQKKSGFGDHVRRGLDPATMEIARSWQLVDPRLGVVSPAVSKKSQFRFSALRDVFNLSVPGDVTLQV